MVYFVKQHFAGSAEVVFPYDNCQDVRYTYQFLEELFDLNDIKTAKISYYSQFGIGNWACGIWQM